MKNRYKFTSLLAVLFSALVLASCSTDIPHELEMGKNAFYNNNDVMAKNKFKKCADMGDSQGQFWLGYITLLLGGHYSETDSLAMTEEERGKYIFDLFQKSASQGDGDGCWGLYNCYMGGIGVVKDEKKAADYLDKSVELNSSWGYVDKGYELIHKNQVEEGLKLIKKSADAQNYRGICVLGSCYYAGVGVEKDVNKGIELLTESAEHRDVRANSALASLYFSGTDNIEPDYNKAFKYAQKGNYDGKTEYILAQCYIFGHGVEKNIDRGAYHARCSAELGFVLGQSLWASCCVDGYGTMQDAVKYYQMAAEQGDIIATTRLGKIYLNGTAGEINYTKAKKYLRKAASQGNEEAKELLERNYYLLNYY
ncbi:tetratricopeptide repeat protein [Sodaliphilus sp.]|uniref:tetratricopeptide repeat protein n=1 Tax=Sodaliphilus sp. TaxID=2815818 RepID=UPI00389040FE